MGVNHRAETDKILAELSLAAPPPRLLLHSCCGPCAGYVLEYLSQYFKISVLYYNPNIKPVGEYELRLQSLKKIIESMETKHPVDILPAPYMGGDFDAVAMGREGEPEGGKRCGLCFELRLRKTAETAKRLGFPWYCTTLTVSPHKNAAVINEIGRREGERGGICWLPSDFKKRDGYKRSVMLAEQYGLYRQNYCGCTPKAMPEKILEKG